LLKDTEISRDLLPDIPNFRTLRLSAFIGIVQAAIGQRLAGVGGVVDFVWRLIVVRLMNPAAQALLKALAA